MSDSLQNGENFSFDVPARACFRSAVGSFISSICEELRTQERLNEESSHQIMSAFLEGFNNVVTHAYPGTATGRVELLISVKTEYISLSLFDEGEGFDFEAIPVPELDSLPEGGMGIYIMKNFMDRVEYKRDNEKNMLYLEKRYV